MCILLYLTLFDVVVFPRSMVIWRWGTCGLGICAFCYMLNLYDVVVFYRTMVNWRWGALVHVHSAICETDLMWWYSLDLWSIVGRVHLP